MKALPTPKKGAKGEPLDYSMPSTVRVPVHPEDMKHAVSGSNVEVRMRGKVVGTHAPLKGEKGHHHIEIQPTHSQVKAHKPNQFSQLVEDDDGDGN